MKINKLSCQATETNIFKKGPWKQLRGAFHWTKIPVWPMEMNIGCTDPTRAKSRLLIVLLSRLLKSGCKEKQLTFSNGKGRFGPTDRNDWTGQSGPPSKAVLYISVRRNQNGPLHLISSRKLPEVKAQWKATNARNSRHWSTPSKSLLLSWTSNWNVYHCFRLL